MGTVAGEYRTLGGGGSWQIMAGLPSGRRVLSRSTWGAKATDLPSVWMEASRGRSRVTGCAMQTSPAWSLGERQVWSIWAPDTAACSARRALPSRLLCSILWQCEEPRPYQAHGETGASRRVALLQGRRQSVWAVAALTKPARVVRCLHS